MLMMADDSTGHRARPESLRLAEELGLAATRARNLNTIGVARVQTGDASGLGDLEQAVEIARGRALPRGSRCAGEPQLDDGPARRPAAGGRAARAVADVSGRLGSSSFIRWQEAERAFHCHWDGSLGRGARGSDQYFVEIGRRRLAHYMEGSAGRSRLAISLRAGELDRALADARRATELSRPIKDPAVAQSGAGLRGQVGAGRRRAGPRRMPLADELVELWRARGSANRTSFRWRRGLFRELGRSEQVLEAIDGRDAQSRPWHEAARQIASGDLLGAAESFARSARSPTRRTRG